MKSKEDGNLDAHPAGSIVLVIIGVAITMGSFRYGFGSFEEPGAGFLPFFTGVSIIVFASIPLMLSLKRGWMPLRSPWEGTKWYRVIVVIATASANYSAAQGITGVLPRPAHSEGSTARDSNRSR